MPIMSDVSKTGDGGRLFFLLRLLVSPDVEPIAQEMGQGTARLNGISPIVRPVL
jgi:hypothetical protein